MDYSCYVFGGVARSLITRTRGPEFYTGDLFVGPQKDRRCSNTTRARGRVPLFQYLIIAILRTSLRQAAKTTYKSGQASPIRKDIDMSERGEQR